MTPGRGQSQMNEQVEVSDTPTRPAGTAQEVDGGAPAREAGSRDLIEFRRVSKIFGSGRDEVRALEEVSLNINEGEFFTLLGPSGCGKTTLLRMLAGFEQPSAGQILLDGTELTGLPPYRRPVNTVFQSYALFPHMTVAQNVGFGLEMHGVPRERRNERVREMLALVKLEGYERRKPAQLSGGQQQRVALARALANQPRVLLLDEPLSALDLKLRKEMQIELKRLQVETGLTFVFVTHDQEEALTMSDRIAVMNAGNVLQAGTPRLIYEDPDNRFVADFIGETNLIEATVESVGEDGARFRLASNVVIDGSFREGLSEGREVTLALRPERAEVTPVDAAVVRGLVENIVYFGTDTLYQVAVDEVGMLHVRTQNVAGGVGGIGLGDEVGVRFLADAVRVLRD